MTTETATIPASITALDYTCFELVYPNGAFVDTGDCLPHYKSESEAAAAAPNFARPEMGGTPRPDQLDGPCYLATAHCGHVFDEGGAGAMHHEDADDALTAAKDVGWMVGPDHTLRCSDNCKGCNGEGGR